MKKILLPIFGGFLLTSSIGLTTGQHANAVIKTAEQKTTREQELLNSWYSINSQSGLTEEKITELEKAYQSWDKETIDNVLNQALQYQDNHLTLDINNIDATKVPVEILENIDLALDNLNNAVVSGFIKVNITSNNKVELIYPEDSNNILRNSNNEIIYSFNSQPSLSLYTAYMWYSTYGPSRWWKVWEWGGYVHFSEQAVQNAEKIYRYTAILDIIFIFKNIKEISNVVNKLKSAWAIGSNSEIAEWLGKLAKILGENSLSYLGNVVDILDIFTAIIIFGLALTSATSWLPILAAVLELFFSLLNSILSQMINADWGHGVKWKWANFIIPWGFLAE